MAAAQNGEDPSAAQFREKGFPRYLQRSSRQLSKLDDPAFCKEWAEAVRDRQQSFDEGLYEGRSAASVSTPRETGAPSVSYDPVWETIREEAQRDAGKEPLLSSYLYASIMSHHSFEGCLAFVLANLLEDTTMLATQLIEIFGSVLKTYPDIGVSARRDVMAHYERDPSCTSYCQALLYFKGYHAIQAHRISHALWEKGQKILALRLQSRISEVFTVDVHPGAVIGGGILLDHATGVVIGETAVIGEDVSIMQGVTLGGTGKVTGDRHPKVGPGVLIGAKATILGNIAVGEGALVAAGSLVLKPVPPHTMVAGSPAKHVGPALTEMPALEMAQGVSSKAGFDFCKLLEEAVQAQPLREDVPKSTARTRSDVPTEAAFDI